MAKKNELGRDSGGRFRRYLGWKLGNGERLVQHLFRLGKDEVQAKIRNRRLEQLWDCIVARWKGWKTQGGSEPCPLWDDETLAMGMAIARGDDVCTLPCMIGMGPD